jgi:hypothetical protein
MGVGNGVWAGQAGGGLPPATVLVGAHYLGVYRSRGPPLPASVRVGAGSGGRVAPVVDPAPLLVTVRNWLGG